MEGGDKITSISNSDIINMLNGGNKKNVSFDNKNKSSSNKFGGGNGCPFGKKFHINTHSKCSSDSNVLSIDNEFLN